MFTIEQNIARKGENKLKKALFQHGTTLARPDNVKKRFSYKEFILVFGIVVAVLVALSLWDNHRQQQNSATENSSSLYRGIANTGKNFFHIFIKVSRPVMH